jgi:hypothetical protein
VRDAVLTVTRPYRLLPLVLVAMTCDATTKDLSVSHAVERPFSGGPAGVSGTTYGITVVSAHPLEAVKIAGVWIGDTYVPSGTTSRGTLEIAHQPKGDAIEYRVRCEIRTVGSAPRPDERAATKPRPAVSARVVLDVFVDGRERFVPVTDIEALPTAQFP